MGVHHLTFSNPLLGCFTALHLLCHVTLLRLGVDPTDRRTAHLAQRAVDLRDRSGEGPCAAVSRLLLGVVLLSAVRVVEAFCRRWTGRF